MQKIEAPKGQVAKKAYRTPEVVTHGTVEKLTQHHDQSGCHSDLSGRDKNVYFWW